MFRTVCILRMQARKGKPHRLSFSGQLLSLEAVGRSGDASHNECAPVVGGVSDPPTRSSEGLDIPAQRGSSYCPKRCGSQEIRPTTNEIHRRPEPLERPAGCYLRHLENGETGLLLYYWMEWARRSPADSIGRRKVRAPQGTVVGNAHRPRGQGKCHRKDTAGQDSSCPVRVKRRGKSSPRSW